MSQVSGFDMFLPGEWMDGQWLSVDWTAGTDLLTTDYMVTAFGEPLMRELSNLAPKQDTVDYVRLQMAVDDSMIKLYRWIKKTVYVWPLTGLTEGDALWLRDALQYRAMAWLYEHRPGKALDENGRPINYGAMYDNAFKLAMRQLVTRHVRLAATLQTDQNRPTGVVTASEGQRGIYDPWAPYRVTANA